MDRLSKKCVIASGIVHGTLVLVLIVGPAFLGSNEQKFDPKEIIDFVPYKTIEDSISGGGRPDVPNVPPPAQIQPERQSAPPAQRDTPKIEEPKVEQSKDTPKVDKRDPESLEVVKPKPANKIVLKRINTNTTTQKEIAKAEAKVAREAEDKRQKEISNNLSGALTKIRTGTSSGGVQIELRGPGGGGIPYAGFNQALASTYMRNWIAPSDSADSGAKVIAAITLSRDGKVITSRITKGSGNADLDKSVQEALDKVSFVAPFPESVKDAQKTFYLEFDPKTKRMIG
jgi:TonB family protein